MATLGRGLRRVLWGLCLAVAVACVGYVVWCAVAFLTDDDPFDTHAKVGCSFAMGYAHGTLPEQATDEDCVFADWMDDSASGTFRMPRADARSWLGAAYPDDEIRTSCGPDVDLCLRAGFEDTSAAAEVRIDVTYEDGHTALVRLSAFSM